MAKRPIRNLAAVLSAALLACGSGLFAQADESKFITLGTQGGPMSSPVRSQPANAVVVGKQVWLVDAGDGAVQQLANAGFPVFAVQGVFLSHLHGDHIGGLLALLALRNQLQVPGKMTIYGPPGTAELVAGLTASLRPSATAGFGIPGQALGDPTKLVTVVEIADGSSVEAGAMTVTSRQNTHYSFVPGSEMDRRYKSLAFRFDLPGRSIVYTGDTGPSPAVEALSKNADLLVSEMIDPEETISALRRNNPATDKAQIDAVVEHLSQHHLTPDQVGRLAAAAHVKRLVVTHIAAGDQINLNSEKYANEIHEAYPGPVTIARDLDAF